MTRSLLRNPFVWWAIALLVLGAGLRLYDLTDQPIDFHATRQLRGAIVARGLYYQMLPGADPAMRQRAQAFSDSTGQYEPPILEAIVAGAYLLTGQEAFWIARIFTTLFWLVGAMAVFVLARRMAVSARPGGNVASSDAETWVPALVALAYVLVLPFSVQASRSFQPDPGMTMWLSLSALALYRWSEEQGLTKSGWKWALLAGLFSGLAVLTKAVAIFIVGGAFLALILYALLASRSGSLAASLLRLLRNSQVWVIGILMVVPTAIYYLSRQGRAAEYFSSWTLSLSHLLLQPRFYLGWLNLVQELLTPFALLAALGGVWIARGRNRWLLVGLWVGYLVYGLFLPYQMDTHSYYHLMLVPIIALSLAPLVQWVVRFLLEKSRLWQAVATGLAVLALAFLSWQALIPLYSQDYRDEPAYWQEIASHLPADGKIIALTQDYGYRLMYYGWRKVTLWPNRGEIRLNNLRGSSKEFDEFFAKRTQDKSYFLITAFRQYEDQPVLQQTLSQQYPILAQTPGYIIFDLTRPLQAESAP
jgi:4-amino-4-deoxy-L-arabinose transferase-like glycosyltransferase